VIIDGTKADGKLKSLKPALIICKKVKPNVLREISLRT
jgi:hypothetical protein